MYKHKRFFFIAVILLAFPLMTVAQTKLKFDKTQVQYWNDYQSKWTGWPGIWSEFEDGNEPVIKITNFGDGDYMIELWIDGEYSSLAVEYSRYNSSKKWYIYKDEIGDEISVEGSTLSSLAANGWPSNLVKIYFWLYSEDMAMVMK